MRSPPRQGLNSAGLQNLNILLFGNDQVGKTSTGNLILNFEGLNNVNFDRETGYPICNSNSTEHFPGKLILVIDTPGFGRFRRRVMEAIKQKKDKVSSRSGTFSVLFVVRADRVSDRDCSESIQSFKDVFGRQFSGRIIMVVTCLDKVGGNMTVERFLGCCGRQLSRFIAERNLRVCFFDNVTNNNNIRMSQAKTLISMIENEENTRSWNFLNWSAAAVVVAGIALAMFAIKW